MLSTMLGRSTDADEYLSRAHAIMQGAGEPVWIVRFWLSFVHLSRRDASAAEAELRPGYDALRRLGETSQLLFAGPCARNNRLHARPLRRRRAADARVRSCLPAQRHPLGDHVARDSRKDPRSPRRAQDRQTI